MNTDEKKMWRQKFINVLSKLPDKLTISLSGGTESSMIVYGLMSIDKKPDYCITFQIGGGETNDLYFSKKICKHFNIKQIIAPIPILNKEQLTKRCKEVIKEIGVSRSIDTLVCFAYSYMLPLMKTKNIVLGLYEGAHYECNAKATINYHKYVKGKISFDEAHSIYNKIREKVLTDENYNHQIIKNYISNKGFNVYTPLSDRDLFNYSLKFDYHDFHFNNENKYKVKFAVVDMFSDYFDIIGNHWNRNQFHKSSGLSLNKYHSDVLLPDSNYKVLNGVYYKFKKEIDNEQYYSMFFGE